MFKNHCLQGNPAARADTVVAGDRWRFTVLTDRLIRMEYQVSGRFEDAASQRVVNRDFAPVPFSVTETEDELRLHTGRLLLRFGKTAFSPESLSVEALDGSFSWRYGDRVDDLKGTARTLDNADGPIALEPGLMSRGGFTVLDDSDSALLTEDGWVRARENRGEDLYFFGYGHDYQGCLKDFYRLSGFPPLLPRFVFGNWWSRFYPYTEESYLRLMDQFRAKELPFSVAVIDIDWHLTDIPKEIGGGWTGYTWNRAYFPDPARFLGRLHERGLHTTLNVHPADGVRSFEEPYAAMAEALGRDPASGEPICFDAADRAFMEVYFRVLHHPLEEQGVDFWWIDWQQGERGGAAGTDPLWMLNYLHFLDSGRDGRTPLIFSRYAGLGSHRYPIGFSGDSVSTWASLRFQTYFTANASNAGYTWWSHDIGGHQGGRRDDELAVRWLQFGVFSPIMRLHSTANAFMGKEPWNYNIRAEQIMSFYLRLRHRLIPYLYSMNVLTHREGLPLLRPMYYIDDVPEAYEVPGEYSFGTELIVSPITEPLDQESQLAGSELWLPEGTWMDLFTGIVYRGGSMRRMFRPMETVPVLAKAGAIVPMAADGTETHLRNPVRLELLIVHGADGEFELWESDEAGSLAVSRIRYRSGPEVRLELQPEGDLSVIPEGREVSVYLRGILRPTQVLADGNLCDWEYQEAERMLCVRLSPGRKGFALSIQSPGGETVTKDRSEAIFRLLNRAQIPYSTKTAAWALIEQDPKPEKLLERLKEIGLNDGLSGGILELLAP